MILASVKGFGRRPPLRGLKVYENVAQCAGGAASTTGFDDGPPLGHRRADRRQRHRHAPGHRHPRPRCTSATRPARARRSLAAMQDAVLNLCRVKLRDQQRLDRIGYLEEYPQYPRHGKFGDAVPRARQCRRRRPAGLDPEVQGLGDRPQRLHLLHDPGPGLGADLQGDRQARVEHRPELHDAQGAPAAHEDDLRDASRTGPRTRPSSRRWTSCASSTSPARRSCR